jgi:hypothetical protein
MKGRLNILGIGSRVVMLLTITLFGLVPCYSQGAEIHGRIVTWILEDTIPEANVRLKGPFSQHINAVNGFYGFSGLPAGEYSVSVSVYGYTPQSHILQVSDSSRYTLDFKLVSAECPIVSAERAKKDLQVDSMKLFFVSGFAGYEKTDNDRRFERLFKIYFIDLGCVDPGFCKEEYNRVIISFLDQRYGKRWHDLVDIPAFRTKSVKK